MASSLTDTRKTYIQMFNEVRRKVGLNEKSTLDADKYGTVLIDYMNDVVAEISDYGDWQEMYREQAFTFVTAQSSVSDYVFDTSVAVKNIHEIQFGDQTSPMRLVTLDDINRLNRVGSTGRPQQWAVVGVDNTATGNPRVRVFPTPVTAQAGNDFNVKYYQKPAIITSADTSTLGQFPSRMMVQGLLAFALKDEERGSSTQQWRQEYMMFQDMIRETYNRYHGDMGSDTYFVPSRGRRSR